MWKATTESIITLFHIFFCISPSIFLLLTLLLLSLFSILFFILFSTISTTDSVASKDQWEPPSSPSAIAEPSEMFGWQGLEQAEQLSKQEQLFQCRHCWTLFKVLYSFLASLTPCAHGSRDILHRRFALYFYHGGSG